MRHRHSLVKLIAVISLFLVGSSTAVSAAATSTEVVSASSISKKRNAIAKLAKKQVGKSYVYGATGPSAFDCSGLVQYVFRKAGKTTLPRTTYSQVTVGKSVSLHKLKKGDLLFWGSPSAPYHVGICVGKNKFVHAATPTQGVKEQTLSVYFYPSAAKRILN